MSPFDQIQVSPLMFRGSHGRGGTGEFDRTDRYTVIQQVIQQVIQYSMAQSDAALWRDIPVCRVKRLTCASRQQAQSGE